MDWSGEHHQVQDTTTQSVENPQLADDLIAFYCRFERPDSHSTPGLICTSHIHPPPMQPRLLPPHHPTGTKDMFRGCGPGLQEAKDCVSPACLKIYINQLTPSSHRSSRDLWSCAMFPTASNTPLSFRSPQKS